jgi:hypothetical protein
MFGQFASLQTVAVAPTLVRMSSRTGSESRRTLSHGGRWAVVSIAKGKE